MNDTIIYTINPESNQIVLKSAEEVAKMTGIDIEKNTGYERWRLSDRRNRERKLSGKI